MLPALLFAKSCDGYWNDFIEKYDKKPRFGVFLEYWKSSVGEGCINTPGYYYYLANSYEPGKNSQEAIKFANKGLLLKNGGAYKNKLKLVKYEAELTRLLKNKKPTDSLEKKYLQIMNGNKSDYYLLSKLSKFYLLNSKVNEAKIYAEESLKIKESFQAYEILAECWFIQKNYQKVIESVLQAAKYDKYIYSNQNVMIATAISYASLGDFKMASNVMNLLLLSVPNIENDKHYTYAEKYLNYLYTKSKEKEESKGEGKNAK